MRAILHSFFLMACCNDALRISSDETAFQFSQDVFPANQFSSSRVDTVLVFKTQDTGSTFLDEVVFPKMEHVARWETEFNSKNDRFGKPAWGDMHGWFKHEAGEEIVGGSYNFDCLSLCTSKGARDQGFVDKVMPHFANAEYGKILLIKLYRNPVEKWINIMRHDPFSFPSSFVCDKTSYDLRKAECQKPSRIDPEVLLRYVKHNQAVDDAIDNLISHYVQSKPNVFRSESFSYEQLVSCQGIPQRINRHFGKDVDGCDYTSGTVYQKSHPQKKIREMITNYDEVQKKFAGTQWESFFANDPVSFGRFD